MNESKTEPTTQEQELSLEELETVSGGVLVGAGKLATRVICALSGIC